MKLSTAFFATVALSALTFPSIAVTRPMTATDTQMMRRMGAPEVSPNGRTAILQAVKPAL